MQSILETLRTDILVANRAVVGPEWGREYGRSQVTCDPYARLYCIEAGRANVIHHGRRYDLRIDGLHVIPANTIVHLNCDRRATISYLHFTAVLLGEIDLFDFLQCPYDLRPENFERIVARMDESIHAFNGSSLGKVFEVKGLLLQLLSPFLATSDTTTDNPRQANLQRFGPVLQYIDANLHRRITLADLATIVHLEPTYFSHQFACAFGLPPTRYVLRRRVERAQHILWNTNDALEAIAEQLAFSDAFHFSKTFKRIIGMSPSVYRQRKGLPGP